VAQRDLISIIYVIYIFIYFSDFILDLQAPILLGHAGQNKVSGARVCVGSRGVCGYSTGNHGNTYTTWFGYPKATSLVAKAAKVRITKMTPVLRGFLASFSFVTAYYVIVT